MKKSDVLPATEQSSKRLRQLTAELQELEDRLRLGGGPDKIERQHSQGKLTARERIDLLLDKDSYAQEIGLLVAYDEYDGGAPAAGVGEAHGLERDARTVVSPKSGWLLIALGRLFPSTFDRRLENIYWERQAGQ